LHLWWVQRKGQRERNRKRKRNGFQRQQQRDECHRLSLQIK
jgi:hypothetical protein